MNFCPTCGSDSLRQQIPEGDNRLRIVCQQCETIHYQNPKLVVGCLPVWNDQILLCRRAIEPRKGYWNLPAGYMENGETVEQAAVRETLEETGAEVSLLRLHTVYNLPTVNQVYLFFLANVESHNFDGGTESLEVKLFHPDEIPYQEMAFVSSTFAIRQYLDDTSFHGVHSGTWPPA